MHDIKIEKTSEQKKESNICMMLPYCFATWMNITVLLQRVMLADE